MAKKVKELGPCDFQYKNNYLCFNYAGDDEAKLKYRKQSKKGETPVLSIRTQGDNLMKAMVWGTSKSQISFDDIYEIGKQLYYESKDVDEFYNKHEWDFDRPPMNEYYELLRWLNNYKFTSWVNDHCKKYEDNGSCPYFAKESNSDNEGIKLLNLQKWLPTYPEGDELDIKAKREAKEVYGESDIVTGSTEDICWHHIRSKASWGDAAKNSFNIVPLTNERHSRYHDKYGYTDNVNLETFIQFCVDEETQDLKVKPKKDHESLIKVITKKNTLLSELKKENAEVKKENAELKSQLRQIENILHNQRKIKVVDEGQSVLVPGK